MKMTCNLIEDGNDDNDEGVTKLAVVFSGKRTAVEKFLSGRGNWMYALEKQHIQRAHLKGRPGDETFAFSGMERCVHHNGLVVLRGNFTISPDALEWLRGKFPNIRFEV